MNRKIQSEFYTSIFYLPCRLLFGRKRKEKKKNPFPRGRFIIGVATLAARFPTGGMCHDFLRKSAAGDRGLPACTISRKMIQFAPFRRPRAAPTNINIKLVQRSRAGALVMISFGNPAVSFRFRKCCGNGRKSGYRRCLRVKSVSR